MKIKGRAFKYGNNVDTDVIIPARYLNSIDPAELAKCCLEDLDPQFVKKVKPGDLIVAGDNFGCGSSREHAALAIRAAGVSCIIARSFARIFYRNAINIGLPILECKEAAESIESSNEVEVDFQTGTIKNLSKRLKYQAQPFPKFIQDIMDAGGLINYINKNLKYMAPTNYALRKPNSRKIVHRDRKERRMNHELDNSRNPG
jgi:3-isopropylmalate/(R)-2-methylmalate dehydratase small subunit